VATARCCAVGATLFPSHLDQVRSHHVRSTVEACGGDTLRAAEMLRISRGYVYHILKGDSGNRADALPAPGRLGVAFPMP
jgi:hypothetical protein